MSYPPPADEPDIIPAAQARAILEAAIRERLGERWDDEETGWQLTTGHDYMARLTRGNTNLDFYVDLLGNVTVEETELSGGQEYGRILAWALIIGSMLLALAIAWAAGYL
jgi:hypothetical protein